jgi:2,4-dihydroxyhept-2-ene-1,7-dioic acid aldolase
MINIKQALANGDVLVGPFAVSGSPGVVETIGYAGFDFTIIDTEHAPISPYGSELENLIRTAWSADIAPIVRTTWNDRGQILKAMDMGASAVVVPHINTAEEAAAAVSAAFYAPKGRRSAAPPTLGSKRGFVDWKTYHQRGLEDTLVFPLIEEWEGVQNIEEIAAVPNLGGIFFGPFDLAVSMGKPASAFEPDVPEERARVYAAAKANNLPIADLAWDVPSALDKIKLGAQLIALGTDVTLFANALKELLGEINEMKKTLSGIRQPVG